MIENRYGHMVQEYYVARVRSIMNERATRLAAIQTKGDAEAYVLDVRAKIKQVFPALPERTDLKAEITGTLDFDEFRVEKVVYESRPGFKVSANLYLPTQADQPSPCVLGLCGHSPQAKAYLPYQSFAQGLARKGFVVLIIDPIEQGERHQFFAEDGGPVERCTVAHNMIGNRMRLTGDFIGSWFVWDAIRGLDYLVDRPETDSNRVGVTGCSGGGTQTTWLTALDPRITMAVPDCFITSWLSNLENELPADAEQCPPNSLALGLDEVDMLLAFATRPTMILAEENCFFDVRGAKRAFLEMQRIHQLLDSPYSTEISVGPLDHGFHKHAREEMYRFFIKHVDLQIDWREPEIRAISEEDLQSAQGEVVTTGSKKVFAFTQERARVLKDQRNQLGYDDLAKVVTEHLHITYQTTVSHHRYLRGSGGRNPDLKKGCQFAVETEPGIQTILTMYGDLENACRLPTGNLTLYVGHHSAEADCETLPWLQDRLALGEQILAVDPRGMGQSFPTTCGSTSILEPYGSDYMYASYADQMGESYLGQRVHDLLCTIDLLVDAGSSVKIIGRGIGSIPAVLAAFLHQSRPVCERVKYQTSYEFLVDKPYHNWPV
ncbi:MAG: acetylxylan esterase [Chloroflexota bacterium]